MMVQKHLNTSYHFLINSQAETYLCINAPSRHIFQNSTCLRGPPFFCHALLFTNVTKVIDNDVITWGACLPAVF